ncbi:Putative RING-H2 finger protein ATL49 [Apostasia shenzhenica]|uniref:RING-type E3 ubiquitin transferase n=1 Tax=Apostasia shenzhenica TaxID=1088818 RepID=A0A2I0BCD4_9ASPA|nr:Putative RING-H2 finger protein ATL49 [Apostasia shenzhenica]
MLWVLKKPSNGSVVFLPPPPPPAATVYENKISPSILLIIIILAVVFFISGLLHLLVRFLLRPTARQPADSGNATALQGQLQELFHLHDAGLDQYFIDALPVFVYKAIVGPKEHFDCAVCLCEFEEDDKLRLLPKCSHAFHIECIDTWLLAHSTCPLCRRSLLLLPDFSPVHSSSPPLFFLESEPESSITEENGSNPNLGFAPEEEIKEVPVKLGKFRFGEDEGSSSCNNGNGELEQSQRRCFSMGAHEYVMEESCDLRVSINPTEIDNKKKIGHRAAMSECDCRSRRGFRVFDEMPSSEHGANGCKEGGLQKRESFSVSKIWLQPKEEEEEEEEKRNGHGVSSRRAFSFRLPLHRALSAEIREWEKSDGELDVEVGSCTTGLGSQVEEAPSFARRTLKWIEMNCKVILG